MCGSVVLAGLLAMSVSAMCHAAKPKLPEKLGSVRLAGVPSFDSDSVANDGLMPWRWLSLPESRVVLNPVASDDFTPLPDRPDLPLHVGYYAGRRPHRLLDLVTMGVRRDSSLANRQALIARQGAGRGGRQLPILPASSSPAAPSTGKAGVVNAASTYRHVWYPYKLGFEAQYNDPPQPGLGITSFGQLTGCDFLADENTVVRLVRPRQLWEPTLLQFHGVVSGAAHPGTEALLVEHEDFFYALAVGRAGGSGFDPPSPASVPQVSNGQWHVEVSITTLSADEPLTAGDPEGKGDALLVAVAFATRAEGADAAMRRIRRVFSGPGPAKRLEEQKVLWNDYLRRVPAPEKFGIEAIDDKGVTSKEHRLFYYGAWAFAISNVLPPMPENDYPYPQTPCGKPSLWNFGASKAPASAAWESFFGQQLLAYVMPETAWAAFEGIMGQVDATGWLDGECLPSRKAQTAWILYNLTGNAARLRAVYPAIRRYLLWREKNPRWIYLDHNSADEKDASFVDQLLVDIDFAVRIARTLGDTADIEMWQQRREAILKNYREWFFFADGRPPAEYYFTESKRHEPGNPNWVVSGLHIRDLPADLADQLKRVYLKRHDRKGDLCGMGWTKYGTESFTAYGLIEHGMLAEAREFINAQLRDQIRANEFSENYAAGKNGPPRATGVRPSLFGVAQMIDFTCLNNGVRLDQGLPVAFDWDKPGSTRPAGENVGNK